MSICLTCGDAFGVPVWECPSCGAHMHAGNPERLCDNCYTAGRRGRTSTVAAVDWKRVEDQWLKNTR